VGHTNSQPDGLFLLLVTRSRLALQFASPTPRVLSRLASQSKNSSFTFRVAWTQPVKASCVRERKQCPTLSCAIVETAYLARREKSQFYVQVAGESAYQYLPVPNRSNSVWRIGVSSSLGYCRAKASTKGHLFAQLNEARSFASCPSYQLQLATQRQLGRRLWCKMQQYQVEMFKVPTGRSSVLRMHRGIDSAMTVTQQCDVNIGCGRNQL
jgi:hypothetical protein